MYGWLFLDTLIYFLLGLYLDNVLATEYGTRRPFYYFLTRSYWTGKSRPKSKSTRDFDDDPDEISKTDSDVLAEEEMITNGKLPENTAVKIDHLRKVYTSNEQKKCCEKSGRYVAVKGLSLYLESDTLLCLLGHNGAGKTTTIHMLCGFHEPTSGDAEIFGVSINSNMTEVQRTMGICPQFDVLWGELTGEEHLYLFAGLRDIPPSEISAEVDKLLDAVELQEARKMTSFSYSGGMRRRLSVAISLIGDPKIVFLDEPTTGMDPVSRRKVWNTIEKVKKDKVIIFNYTFYGRS
eukprot:TRINITY_DN2698_c0_g3_i2.p1 TRINITY_DN2698_c0_g3~~TRINITY_DN2698_c0_g3_i2.p1  ORF type:complete len:293 (+),score=63.74 TRINITY_DN2698_c0_g3_i2:360-1238(+)